jgi:hypothetical protein
VAPAPRRFSTAAQLVGAEAVVVAEEGAARDRGRRTRGHVVLEALGRAMPGEQERARRRLGRGPVERAPLGEAALDAEGPRGSEPRLDRGELRLRGRLEPREQDAVGPGEGLRLLAQSAGRQRPVLEVAHVEAHEIEVALEPQVLEAVVEHVDAAAEACLDGPADDVAARSDRDHRAGQGAREHHRLVARDARRREDAGAVAHDERVAANEPP